MASCVTIFHMNQEQELTNRSLSGIFKSFMLNEVPSYANKIYYSLGFLSATSLIVLIASGFVLVFNGPDWWLSTAAGTYTRSVHLWATQAFIFFILLHLLIVFLTSGYKASRRLTWVLGSLMFFAALVEAEFGYGLRGDFSSQWRALQASDLYNGSGLGAFINNINYAQIYGIHIIIIPLFILIILFLHYTLVKVRGLAKPFKQDVKFRVVKANHTVLFSRGIVLVAVILILASFFKSPLILPTTIKSVAQMNPALVAKTLVAEVNKTSDTATYSDSIDPYTYDTAAVYVGIPFSEYVQSNGAVNTWTLFNDQPIPVQSRELSFASQYFDNNGPLNVSSTSSIIATVSVLTNMAQSGLYEASLRAQTAGDNRTYVTRFIADTGVLDAKAKELGMTTEQYGMLHEEKGAIPPGAWWLAPIGFLDQTILANDPNQDRDGAEILGLLVFLLIAFPYIPYINRIPEKIGADRFIWKDKSIEIEK